jgi:hypothetical protein
MNRKTLNTLLILGTTLSRLPLHAQNSPFHLCIVQVKEGFQGDDTTQEKGYDAIKLAYEVYTRKTTKSGTAIVATLLYRMPRAEVDAEVDMQQCDYVVELWRHISADDASAGLQGPGAPSVPPSGDRDAVEYQLRKPGTHKVLASGSAPIITYSHGGGPGDHRASPSPYSILAEAILKKIDH